MAARPLARQGKYAAGRRSGVRGTLCVIALTLIAAGLVAAPAWADLGSAHGERSDALVLALLVSGGAVAFARRRAAILGLALLLALFAVESAVHSVHHLGEAEPTQSCAFSSSSQHVAGTCPEIPRTGTPLLVSEASPRLDQPVVRPLAAFFTFEGRAPPALPAA